MSDPAQSPSPLREPETVLIVGCGYVGVALAELFVERGDRVIGIRRDVDKLPPSIYGIAGDVASPDLPWPESVDVACYLVGPSSHSEDAYRAGYVTGLRNLLSGTQIARHLLFVSSTALYPFTDGRWVDERTPSVPTHFSGRLLAESEMLVRAARVPCATVVRAAGIYGPGRTRLLQSVRDGSVRLPEKDSLYTNRIHRDDLARAVFHLSQLEAPAPLYLAVDRETADKRVVVEWMAARLGVRLPPLSAAPSEATVASSRARPQTNKRCSSDLLASTGFVWRYPTFREGYCALL